MSDPGLLPGHEFDELLAELATKKNIQAEAHGADQALIALCSSDAPHNLAHILSLGADPLRARDPDGATALMLAAHGSWRSLCAALLDLSDPNATDFEGWNALFCALEAGALNCSKLLTPRTNLAWTDKSGLDALSHCPSGREWDPLRGRFLAARELSILEAQALAPAVSSSSPRL